MANTHASEPPQVSKRTFPIAGIATTVFGLDELPSQASTVACLWLLHPRLATQERMTGIAATIITDWNKKLAEGQTGSNQGLIAVSFDQRNHGTRLVEPLANEAWKQGNPRHAQDMFSIFRKWSPGACRSHSIYGVIFLEYRLSLLVAFLHRLEICLLLVNWFFLLSFTFLVYWQANLIQRLPTNPFKQRVPLATPRFYSTISRPTSSPNLTAQSQPIWSSASP